MTNMNVAVGIPDLCGYLEAGGHWSWALQYLLGLKDLGHNVCMLEFIRSSGRQQADQQRIDCCLAMLNKYGLRESACVIVVPAKENPSLENMKVYCTRYRSFEELASDTDILLNFGCTVRPPLLQLFGHRILLDEDPGHLQISALSWELGIYEHHRWLTVGLNVGHEDCLVPTLGLNWETHFPVVYLPMWTADVRPLDPSMPISSVTHWSWDELSFKGNPLHIGKREAYLRYVDLPARTGESFELAVVLPDKEIPAERQRLEAAGWKIIDPWREIGSPEAYQAFIRHSRAELCCAKEAFRVLNTGWLSDRSAAYMALGRPVIADDTGFRKYIETGRGLLSVQGIEDAVSAVIQISRDYETHSRIARELASAYFDSRRVLPKILGV